MSSFMNSSSDSLRASQVPINVSSSSYDDQNARNRFKVRLSGDYKKRALVPKLPNLGEGRRWVLIHTRNNETYKVEMLDCVAVFELSRGWSLLAAVENLREVDRLLFHVQGENHFHVAIHSPSNNPPRIGFSHERIPAVPLDDIQNVPMMVTNGVELNTRVKKAIQRVWNASSVDGTVYVCRLKISPTKGKCLIFHKAYKRLIPKNHGDIAMRFVGSSVIIPGAIRTYTDGNPRMVKDWRLYAAQHNLMKGEVFVCKIHRGPAVWEFIGSCAR